MSNNEGNLPSTKKRESLEGSPFKFVGLQISVAVVRHAQDDVAAVGAGGLIH